MPQTRRKRWNMPAPLWPAGHLPLRWGDPLGACSQSHVEPLPSERCPA